MLNHKVQTERRQEEIWQSNSQIILMLPLNKLTNAATLHKKKEKEKYSEGRMSRTDRQSNRQTDRQSNRQTDSCLWSCCCCSWFLNRLSCQPSCIQHLSACQGNGRVWQGAGRRGSGSVPLWHSKLIAHILLLRKRKRQAKWNANFLITFVNKFNINQRCL